MDHGNNNHGFTGTGEVLIVLAQSTVAFQPGKGAFNDPASWQQHKALDVGWPQDGLKHPAANRESPLNQRAGVGRVSPDERQAWKLPLGFLQQQPGAVAVLDVAGVNHGRQQQSRGIDQDVAFAARYLFFPRRSRERRLDVWSSRSGCPGRLQKVVGGDLLPFATPAAGRCGSPARCRPAPSGGNNHKRFPTEGNHAAPSARRSQCTGHRRWH
jgi:hypothetical protein